jgi:hypothetical protein
MLLRNAGSLSTSTRRYNPEEHSNLRFRENLKSHKRHMFTQRKKAQSLFPFRCLLLLNAFSHKVHKIRCKKPAHKLNECHLCPPRNNHIQAKKRITVFSAQQESSSHWVQPGGTCGRTGCLCLLLVTLDVNLAPGSEMFAVLV